MEGIDLSSLFGPPSVGASVEQLKAAIAKYDGVADTLVLVNFGSGTLTVRPFGSDDENDGITVAYKGEVFADSEDGLRAAAEASEPYLPTEHLEEVSA